MKNVLIISSSPRKGGNSDVLCDAFLKGAQEGNHQVEKINLKDLNIGFCRGCGTCFEKGIPCPKKMTPLKSFKKCF